MPLDIAHTRQLLDRHQPFDAAEDANRQAFHAFLDKADPATASSADGVLTAAGWVIDRVAQKVLLIRNAKLDLWLNPGGKYEPEDGTVFRAMQREVRQESGITAAACAPLFDLSVIGLDYNHNLKVPMFDFRFLVEVDSRAPLRPHEADKLPQWLSLPELKQRMPDDIQNYRLLRRTEAAFGL